MLLSPETKTINSYMIHFDIIIKKIRIKLIEFFSKIINFYNSLEKYLESL